MTSSAVFVGPTLDAAEVAAALPRTAVLAPAARGDVYRAVRGGATVIGLIDGVFERVPSVWHKEVLYALEQGAIVFGSSSMGALRAAELAPFGMRGIGKVHDLVVGGLLDDDDVAVAHAGPEAGHRCLSDALVDLRLSMERAVRHGVVDRQLGDRLVAAQKARFYPDRSVAALVEDAETFRPGLGPVLRQWLLRHRVHQKRDDARALLGAVAAAVDDPEEPARRVRMARTIFFERMVVEEASYGSEGAVDGWAHPVLEELQLRPDLYHEIERRASRTRHARELAMRSGLDIDQALVDETSDRLRSDLGLIEPSDLMGWLDASGMDPDDYTTMIDRRARAAVGTAMLPPLLDVDLIDELRVGGQWGELAARSGEKARALRDRGWDESGAGTDDRGRDEAISWWLRQHFGTDADIDLAALAGSLGFDGVDDLCGAALREYRFVHAP